MAAFHKIEDWSSLLPTWFHLPIERLFCFAGGGWLFQQCVQTVVVSVRLYGKGPAAHLVT